MIWNIIKRDCLTPINIILVTIFLFLNSFLIYTGQVELPNGYSLQLTYSDLSLDERIKLIKSYNLHQIVDDKYIELFQKEYKTYVDKNKLDNEIIKNKCKEFNIDFNTLDIYDYSNSGIVLPNLELNQHDFTRDKLDALYSTIQHQKFIDEKELYNIEDTQYDSNLSDLPLEYIKTLNDKWIAQFNGKKLHDGDSLGFEVWISSYPFMSIFMGLSVVILLSQLFYKERKDGMNELITSSKEKKKYYTSKWKVMFLVTTSVFLVFEIITGVMILFQYGLVDFDTSAYKLMNYTIANQSYLSLLIKELSLTFISLIAIGSLTLVSSYYLENRFTIGVFIVYLFLSVRLFQPINIPTILCNDLFYNLNPASLLTASNYFYGGNNFWIFNILIPGWLVGVIFCIFINIFIFMYLLKKEVKLKSI